MRWDSQPSRGAGKCKHCTTPLLQGLTFLDVFPKPRENKHCSSKSESPFLRHTCSSQLCNARRCSEMLRAGVVFCQKRTILQRICTFIPILTSCGLRVFGLRSSNHSGCILL